MKTLIYTILILLTTSFNGFGKKELKFNLRYGFVKGGEARIEISDTIYNGNPAIIYLLKAKTTGLTDKIYEINDTYETIVDKETLLPYKSIRKIEEGRYRSYNEVKYYHENDSIFSLKSGARKVPHNLVDILSVFFYFSSDRIIENFQVGEILTMPTLHADKISDVSIRYIRDKMVKTKMGEINCLALTPVVDKGKLLKRSDGLKFYMSKENRVPVLIEFDMKVGALKAILKSYRVDGKEQIKR